jgi:hypothetical protein
MLVAFVFVFFAFQGGSRSINGILNVGCAAQSMVYPTAVIGYNDAQSAMKMDNSTFCFNVSNGDNVAEAAKAF